MNVLCAQPESGRKGVDWLLDESSLLTAPFIHIVKLTKPGNSRTSSSLLHSWEFGAIIILYFIVALLHSTSLAFVFAQGRDDHYFAHCQKNTFQKLWQSWRWSFGLEINVNCMAGVMKGFTQLRARQCWLQWTRHPPPLWFHSLFFQSTSGRCRSL